MWHILQGGMHFSRSKEIAMLVLYFPSEQMFSMPEMQRLVLFFFFSYYFKTDSINKMLVAVVSENQILFSFILNPQEKKNAPSGLSSFFYVSDSIWQDHKSPKRLHRISLTSCLLSYKYPYKTSLAWHHHALMNGVKWREADMPSHACCHKSFNWTSPNGPIVLELSTHCRQTHTLPWTCMNSL